MTPRIHQTGRDWHTPTAPMTGARRHDVFGPVEPMTEEDRCWTWLAIYAASMIGVVLGLVVVGMWFGGSMGWL